MRSCPDTDIDPNCLTLSLVFEIPGERLFIFQLNQCDGTRLC